MNFRIVIEEGGNTTWYSVDTDDAQHFSLTKLKGYSSTTFSRPEKMDLSKEGPEWQHGHNYLPERFWDAVIRQVEQWVRDAQARN